MSKTGNFDIKEIIQLVSDNFCLGITVTEKKVQCSTGLPSR